MKCLVENYPYIDSAILFSHVAEQSWAVFLDSGVVKPETPPVGHAEFDVLAIKPRVTLVTEGQNTTISQGELVEESEQDPLDLMSGYLTEPEPTSESIAYLPGAIGYCSYDLSRRFEAQAELAVNDEQLPEMGVGIYDVLVLVDHRQSRTQLVIRQGIDGCNNIAQEWREIIFKELEKPSSAFNISGANSKGLTAEPIQDNMNRQQYLTCFDAVRAHTIAGDCYQVNLAKRFSARVSGNPWSTYLKLRSDSPAPYGAYLNFPFAQVLSNSPESFIRCRDRQVTTSPIKGTKPRDHTNPENDLAIAEALLASTKDRAENLMIVDLMRNDLSRSCELGSVKVPKLFALHSFANVHHLISTVTGILKENVDVLDLFRRCFPGGSITGAPKIRAMQIIEKLEPHRRGLYCGSVVYVGMDGNLESNIAIRTIVVKDGIARYSAGGGLVIDSDVDQEYQEIIDKASMMTQAIVQTREPLINSK